jgi:hypothetical protein
MKGCTGCIKNLQLRERPRGYLTLSLDLCLLARCARDLLKKLRSTVKTAEIEAMEHSISVAVQGNKLWTSKRPAEFIKASPNSAPRAIARGLSGSNKAKVAS